MMFRTLFVRSMIRFIRTARWIRTARVISRSFHETFDSFLDDFQNFFDFITDLIFVLKISFVNRFIKKQFRFKFKHECFKLDFEAVWSLVRFISKELCQFLWHLTWDWYLNWWLIVDLPVYFLNMIINCCKVWFHIQMLIKSHSYELHKEFNFFNWDKLSVIFFNIQSDFSDIDEMMNIMLQFFVTVDSNCDDCTIIQNFLFVMNLTVFLSFSSLLRTSFKVFSHINTIFMLDFQIT